MRVFLFLLLFMAFTPPVTAAEPAAMTMAQAEQVYICPMHPHISGEKGDNCPICGMALVPKATNNMSSDHQGHEEHQSPAGQNAHQDHQGHDTEDMSGDNGEMAANIRIDPAYMQTLGVKTATVSHHEFGRHIRAFGRIAPSTRLEHAVDVRTKGWIVDLPVDAVGDAVKKGDLLFTYYSPELMSAQSDYLVGSRVGNAEQRLRLFGMDDKAIAALKKKGQFLEKTPFHAPTDGTVTMLNVRKGAHVNEGGAIMAIQDFSRLWVNVDVPLRDLAFLTVGTPATVTIPETGAEYQSAVDFIHPVSDPQSRTVMVRLLLDNPDGVLKPDSYVDAVFEAAAQSRLAVPAEAVLYGGMGAYVIEQVGDGAFRPVMVETGITAQGLTEITSGLSHGQRIVTSGQFMLDAESNLRGGMAAMGHDHGG